MSEIKKILLAEDDPNDVELTLSTLAAHNIANQVEVVRDGAEALDYLFRRGPFAGRPNGNPVVVMLDLKMPKVSGLEVLQKMKADTELRLTPVVVLTSSRESADVARSYEYGANAYVVKPVGFPDFIEAIKHVGVFWAILNQSPGR